ncbi:MAG: hypothetical protein ACD_68C00038G0002 [uncultured bacterium]|nr:MAG: hypothetical protein ACD_68C00038G0002 [uncultured bacterium]
MSTLPKAIENLVAEFTQLPGIGQKTAQRLVFSLLKMPPENIAKFAKYLADLPTQVRLCQNCFNMSEKDLCPLCSNQQRDQQTICVVEDVLDVVALEHTGEYHGVYHVLHGALSPIDGIGPEQLKIKELWDRTIDPTKVSEVILATNPSLEGEATAMYIAKKLRAHGTKVTRIARGLPVGGYLEYADDITISRAMQGRENY